VATKRVYVLRHAKSSWDDPQMGDHDRPLAGRGRRAGAAIAQHMRAAGLAPELVICSTARRTRETLELLEPAVGAAETRLEEHVYGASATDLLELLRGMPEDVDSVLLIGHNPGVQQLVLALAAPGSRIEAVASKFPTGALATLSFDGARWSDLKPESAELDGYVRPRDLR
jgi:phosphohistidine phosphatase